MGTSRAHNGGTNGNVLAEGHYLGLNAQQSLADNCLRYLIFEGEYLFAYNVDTVLFAVGLDYVVKLLDNVYLVALCGEILDYIERERIYHAELQVARLVAHGFLRVNVAVARRDYAYRSVVVLNSVERRGLGVLCRVAELLLDNGVTLLRKAGHHDELRGGLDVGLRFGNDSVAELYRRLRMGDTCGQPYDNGAVELLRKLEGGLCEVLALLRVGGLKHEHLRSDGVMAGVLFVLRGMEPRVVGNADDHAAVNARVARGVERVGGNVEPYVLHSAEASLARDRSTQRRFHSDLLVRSPFRVHFFEFCRELRDLGGRSPGIRGNEFAARFVKAACECFISDHKFFHTKNSPFKS